uniref:Taste receptor type 2 n=1 Tax=Marmota marmota marmota TaxID=9994 RepID=A0A8C6EUW7_MARMA
MGLTECALHIIFTIIISTEFITGILGNGFIILVNFIDWVKIRKICLADQILTALAISRIWLIWALIMHRLPRAFYPSSFLSSNKCILIGIAGILANHYSTWLTTSLSLFYFLKIANFPNPVFLHLKHRVEMVVLMMLLGTLVFLPFTLAVIRWKKNEMYPCEINMTLISKRSDFEDFSKIIIFIIGGFIPFLHLKNMKLNATGFRDPRVKAHIRAIKSVVSFLLLFAIYFLTVIMATLYSVEIQNKLILFLTQIIGCVYPAVHSFILILGNGKLRKASILLLWKLRCT